MWLPAGRGAIAWSSASRNASTVLSQAASPRSSSSARTGRRCAPATSRIVAHRDQHWSSGLTRSSRPQVISVLARILSNSAQSGVPCVELSMRGERRLDRGAAVHPARDLEGLRLGGLLPALLDELLGDHRLVVDHRAQPGDQPVASRVLGEVDEQLDALARRGAERRCARCRRRSPAGRTRSGWAMAKRVPTTAAHRVADDVDAARGRDRRGTRRRPAAPPSSGAGRAVSLTPKPGELQHQQRKCSANRGRLSPKLRQPVTPGPEPWSISSGGPSPASW